MAASQRQLTIPVITSLICRSLLASDSANGPSPGTPNRLRASSYISAKPITSWWDFGHRTQHQ